MKKTLLAAALLAGYTGTALAQNSVTLFGRITPTYVFENVKIDDNIRSAQTVNPIASDSLNQFSAGSGLTGGDRWGLKGTEDIGNGTKIGFMFDFGISSQTGADGAGKTRVSYLSVSNSAWGTVHLGRDYTASSNLLSGISPVGTSYGVMSAEQAFGTFSVTANNQIKYVSPSVSGLTAALSYSFEGTSAVTADGTKIDEGTFGTSNKNRIMVGGLRYSNGPIMLAGAYTQLNPNANTTTDKKPKNWVIGGTYDLKMVKLHAAYGQNIDGIVAYDTTKNIITPSSPDAKLVSGVAGEIRTSQWMAGLSAPVGAAGKVMFSISQLSPGADLNDVKYAVGTGIGSDVFATMTNLGIAYEYSLSKRTALLASYGYVNNYGMVKGLSINQVSAGIRHVF